MSNLEQKKQIPQVFSPQNGEPGQTHHDISSIVGNMVLAHELIVNDNYQLKSFQENTLEKAVRDVVHKAFWDNLQQQLDHDPPQYENALQLLKEIKEIVLSFVGRNEVLKSQIHEVLDMDLIAQEVSHHCFDLKQCARFVVIIMGKLCAPVRDDEVKNLTKLEGIAPTLRGIMEVLEQMKLDMANYKLQEIKPYLMQQCVEYERAKFQQYLEANPDGTKLTRLWLEKAFKDVTKLITSSSQNQKENELPNGDVAKENKSMQKPPEMSATLVMTHAYLMLLNVNDGWMPPETLLMDELRLIEMGYMFDRLALIGSVMLIVSNIFGKHLSTDSAFTKKLKDDLFVLLDGVPNVQLSRTLPNVYEQVITETRKTLEARGIAALTDQQIELLESQITHILDGKNSVHQLIRSRIRDYVLLCMTSEKVPRHNEAPLALANVQEELRELAGRFARLIIHNRNVYQPLYTDIIKSIAAEEHSAAKAKEERPSGDAGSSAMQD
eukprot:gene12909-14239_t